MTAFTRPLPAPWYAVQPEHANGWWVVSTDDAGEETIDASGDGGFNEEDARLISALPDLIAVAKAYEEWEADIILTGDWKAASPMVVGLTQDQLIRLIEIQEMRNAALTKASMPQSIVN